MRILIADDEYPIREWLKFCIEQQFPGQFTYDLAANGQQAYELFQIHHHEIIVADIKMPVLSGLELAKIILQQNFDSYIIILTSYEDFEFARQALKYNIRNYILKSEITDELVKEVIGTAYSQIVSQGEKIPEIESVDKLSSMSYDEFESIVLDSQQKLPAKNHFILGARRKDLHLPEFSLPVSPNYKLSFCLYIHKDTLVICVELMISSSTLLQIQMIHQLLDQLSSGHSNYIFSASNPNDNLSNLQKSIKYAVDSMSLSFYKRQSFYFEPYINYGSKKEINDAYLKAKKAIERKSDHIEALLEQLYSVTKENKLLDIDYIRMLYRSIGEQLLRIFCQDDLDLFTEEQILLEHNINSSFDLNELQSAVNKIHTDLSEDEYQLTNYSAAIQKALVYIHKNYVSITGMNEVAKYVFLSPEYFSRLFKKEMNCNFSVYLNRIRLNKAARLLDETDLKVFEVAEQTGFSSLSYFSRKFKGQFGMNPFNYIQAKNLRD